MAQMGYYVPCEYASFVICEQLFTRLGNDDDFESNCSTFFVEMRDMAFVLANIQACRSNLVIIDELGRGTSTEEGMAITAGISERLLSSTNVICDLYCITIH